MNTATAGSPSRCASPLNMLPKVQVRQFIKSFPEQVKYLSYDQVVNLCNQFFPSLPMSVVDFTNEPFFFRQHEWGGMNVIHRGREITNPQNRAHPFLSDISYIQEKDLNKIKHFGRVNKKGQSMFYGSLNFATVCIETLSKGVDFRKNGSAMVTIGTWKFEQPLKLVQMPHSEKVWKQFYETVSFKSEKLTDEHIRQHNEELKKQINDSLDYEILEFFGDAFAKFDIKSDNDYYLSNYYADRVFNRIPGFNAGEEIDGIIYPSVPNSYQENNIVLKPSVVETKMKFLSAMQVWVVHFMDTGGGAQFIPIEQRVTADKTGKLSWR
jgi:hypothetical protein